MWQKLEERLGDATKDFSAECVDKQRRPILRTAAMQNGAMNTEPVARLSLVFGNHAAQLGAETLDLSEFLFDSLKKRPLRFDSFVD